jgi:hypothetical protein
MASRPTIKVLAAERGRTTVLSSEMLHTVRLLAPLMELRGISRTSWAADAGIPLVTLTRYLSPSTEVGDSDCLCRLLAEAECFVVVSEDGALSEAWRETILTALAERRARHRLKRPD